MSGTATKNIEQRNYNESWTNIYQRNGYFVNNAKNKNLLIISII